jgi:hypothetical protein
MPGIPLKIKEKQALRLNIGKTIDNGWDNAIIAPDVASV